MTLKRLPYTQSPRLHLGIKKKNCQSSHILKSEGQEVKDNYQFEISRQPKRRNPRSKQKTEKVA